MAANLCKNGVTLMAAYKDVVDGRSHANWAVFTYEGDSSIVRLAGKGDGGLEEMVEELSSGKVMYAFCCVKDPNSGLPKYVLINWTGEGVKDSRKGVYANHVSTMANFLKGAHVTVNARAEEDVEPATILAKVAKASGVNFNFHKKTPEQSHEPRGPVGSVYKKTDARDEIQSTAKERFWGQTQRDEKVPPKVAGKRVVEEMQRVEREKREREERQAREREKREKEKSPSIIWNRSFQKTIETEKGKMEQQHTVSVYKKINARDEIQKTNKDHFWAQTQKEEEDRRKESSKRADKEKRELEERRAKGRGKGDNEKKASIIQNRSFQMILEIEKRDKAQQKTQVSVYKKINARDEIQKTQKAEEERRKESGKRAEEEKQRVQREKRELEERQAKEREKREKENRALIIQNSFQKKQEMERVDKTQQKTHTKDEQLRPNKSYHNTGIQTAESVQKANEAKLLISQRSFNPRDVFKQQIQRPGLNNGAPSTPQPGKLRSPFLSQNSSEGGATALEPKHLLLPSPAPVGRKAPSSSSSSTISVGRTGVAPSPVRSDPPVASPSGGIYENDYPPGQHTDNTSSEDEWSDEFEDDDDYDDMDREYETEEPLYEDLYEEVLTTGEDHSLKARALYDYQAANDTEITFDPHDLITGIEKVDVGWWRGYAPNRHYGLFPANYVELL